MRRRRLLALAGATVAGAVSGCTGDSVVPGGGEPTATDDGTTTAGSGGGTRRWRSPAERVAGNGGLTRCRSAVYGARNRAAYRFDPDTGEVAWSRALPVIDFGGAPACDGERLYLTAWNTRGQGVYALDADSGEQRWQFGTEGAATRPILDGDRVYVGGGLDSPTAYALDATRGTAEWHVTVDEYVTAPTVAGERAYVGGGKAHVLYCLDRESGEKRWHRETAGEVFERPIPHDGTVYAVTQNGVVHALAAESGAERWRYAETADPFAVTVVDGTVLVPSAAGLVALSTAEGDVRWTADDRVTSEVSVAGDTLYYGAGRTLVAADAADGTTRWSYETRERRFGDVIAGGIESRPVVTDGAVFVLTRTGDVVAVERPR